MLLVVREKELLTNKIQEEFLLLSGSFKVVN